MCAVGGRRRYVGNTDWMDQAACAGKPTSVFFPERGDWKAVEAAKTICAGCPVLDSCRAYAMGPSVPWHDGGIYAGMTGRERRSAHERDLQR